jgi:hypothetical protein
MKYKNGKELVGKYLNGKTCTAIYKVVGGAVVTLWEFIRSCFGRGFWANERPWNNADGWKNM